MYLQLGDERQWLHQLQRADADRARPSRPKDHDGAALAFLKSTIDSLRGVVRRLERSRPAVPAARPVGAG